MSVTERLSSRRAEILGRWRELVLESDGRAARLLPQGEDPFHDPAGVALARATAALVDVLSGDGPESEGAARLDELVRIGAVQHAKPARAVGFVFLLRRAVHEVLGAELDGEPAEERHRLERRIDVMALEAFDVLVGCREKIFEIRTREVLSSSYLLLKRARFLGDGAGEGPPAGAATP
jgi:hypothetical protein